MTPTPEAAETRLASAIRGLLQKHARYAESQESHAQVQLILTKTQASAESAAILEDSRKSHLHAGVMLAASIDDVVAELSAVITEAVRAGVLAAQPRSSLPDLAARRD